MIAGHWVGEPWGLLGTLAGLAFVALIVIALVALLRSGGGGTTGRGSRPAAVRVLEERYARGEIPRDEFVERRRVLSELSGRAPADEP